MRPLLAIALVVALFAGCVTSPLDAATTDAAGVFLPRFDLNATAPERLSLEAADGVALDLAVWRPDTDEPVPVIVDIGPYFGNLGGPTILEYTAIDLRLAEYFVPRGYAVARGSVRGTGESEGCFDLGGKTEMQDVHDMVEFLGTQPWSNGNVAVLGKSYDGTTPWMAALTQPEHLRTIVPISGITDWYRYMFYDGVSYPEELAFNTYYYLLVDWEVTFPGPDGGSPEVYNTDPGHIVTKNLMRTCDGLVPQTLPQTQSTLTGDHDLPLWIERDYELDWSKVDVPVFMVHGLQDWNVKPDNQLPMFNALDTPKALWAGQWEHDYPDINRFNEDWSRHDWNETLLVWFDHWLKGVEDNGWEQLLHVEAQDQTGVWRNWTAWPPTEVRETTLQLTNGALTLDEAAASTGSFGGPMGTTLEFVSDPLAEDLVVSGQPILDLTLTPDRPLGHVTAILYDESPDGERVELDHGARDIRHRAGRGTGEPASVGEALIMNVTLYPEEMFLAKGHRIVIVLAAEDEARYLASPSGSASYVLSMGAGASVLRLPVSGGALAFGKGDAISNTGTGAPPLRAPEIII